MKKMLSFLRQKLNAFEQGTESLSSSALRTEIVPAETQDIEQKMSTVYIPTAMNNEDVEGVPGKNFFL